MSTPVASPDWASEEQIVVKRRPTAIFVLALLLWSLFAAPVHAHWADQAVAEIKVMETTAEMVLSFPTGLTAWADDDRNGALDPDEVARHRFALGRFLSERVQFTDRGRSGSLTVEPAQVQLSSSLNLSASHTTLKLTYHWREPVRAPVVRYDLFLPGVPTASCLVTIVAGGRVQNAVFTPEHREVAITLGASPFAASSGFVLLGIRHIVTGYDHVLFLLSLLLLARSLRPLVKIVTAFTVAHSITLSLAVLNIVSLPPRWVESAIAASIVYVAAENFWRGQRALRNRWLVTFGFGFVHGLGFASILKELPLERVHLAVSLASFNVGVEIGQVAIVLTAFVGLRLLHAWPKEPLFRLWVSAAAGAAGLLWFVQRALLGS